MVFDFDGTLADTVPIIVRSFNKSLAQNNFDTFPDEQISSLIGLPSEEMFKTILNNPGDNEITSLIEKYRENYNLETETNLKMFTGTLDILKNLKNSGFKLSIATGKLTAEVIRNLTSLQILDYFDLVLGFDSVSKPKPDGQIVSKTLTELNFQASEAIMIGDSHLDIQTGKNAKISTIGVTWGISSFDRMLEEKPDFIVESPSELLEILT